MSGHPERTPHPREELCRWMDRVYRRGMTTTSGGNLSVRADGGELWITPASIDKGGLAAADIVRVRPDGLPEGQASPSSELPMHEAIYRARPDVRAVVHAHPVALVAFSIVGQVPPTRVLHAAWTTCGQPAFAPFRPPGGRELGDEVARVLAAGSGCAILENHGAVSVGSSLAEAYQRFETLELAARTIVKARLLRRDIRELLDSDLEAAGRGGAAEAGKPAGPPASGGLGDGLVALVGRGYRRGLFSSTHGTVSARASRSSFLITPHHGDRSGLVAADLIAIDAGPLPRPTPGRAARLHEAIYRRHPRVGAIITAAPVNATAFSITAAVPDTRTIPESRLVLRTPALAPFRLQFEDPDGLAALVGPDRPVAVVENDGVLVTGATILEAFDRLEVLESTAAALIDAGALGPLSLMPDAAVDALGSRPFEPLRSSPGSS